LQRDLAEFCESLVVVCVFSLTLEKELAEAVEKYFQTLFFIFVYSELTFTIAVWNCPINTC
jgi:hypothetical protein